ncbi:MAG: phosphoribosyltransferase family protein [Ferruginibacter sp.]
MSNRNYILSKEIANKKLQRMAMQVAEENYSEQEIVIIGIKDNGLTIAKKIAALLNDTFKGNIQLLELNLNKRNPGIISIEPLIDFDNRNVLLVDDVANSGKTMLYAMKPLLEKHPARIQTMALVERTHKLYPVDVDYVGISTATTMEEHIFVEVENEEVVGAYLIKEIDN